MEKLTFGKHKGESLQDLGKTSRGRSYLEWGAVNLDNPIWRKKFQEALDTTEIDLVVEANEISREDGLSWEEAYNHAIEEKENQERSAIIEEAFEKARNTLSENLKNIGVPERQLGRVIRMIESFSVREVIEYGGLRFSSKEKEGLFWSAVAQYEIDIEEIEI